MDFKINQEDSDLFKDWIELDFETISWEGRYLKDFKEFWSLLFNENTSYKDQFIKLRNISTKLKSGPLISWFNWLHDRFICYLFIFKGVNLKELKEITGLNYPVLSLVLRDFFLERYPHLEEDINNLLQINNIISGNINLNYQDISKVTQQEIRERGVSGEEVLNSLEVTLYPDWRFLFNSLREKSGQKKVLVKDISKKASFHKQIKFLRELTVLFILGGIIIAGIKFGNKYYEDYLAKQISLYVPNFFELEKNLTFKSNNPLDKEEVELSFKELEKLEKLEAKQIFEEARVQQRFDVESDVVLTSVESLPKDFEVANMEQSTYEETKKGGYRNSRYGRRKAYRIMMTSIDPEITKKEIINLLNFYDVKKADNVEPGTKIPGGIYFNLYVSVKQLTEFLSRVTKIEESTILESKTNRYPPKGTNKVFIWIKSI
jgi:S-adenosylmethionine/arginine decarboxylase-like enzyme